MDTTGHNALSIIAACKLSRQALEDTIFDALNAEQASRLWPLDSDPFIANSVKKEIHRFVTCETTNLDAIWFWDRWDTETINKWNQIMNV